MRLSLDISKGNFKDNYIISKPNYLHPYNYFSLPTNMDMKRKINVCFFMSMIFILIQIKFEIDINNDELLENVQKHKKIKLSWSLLVMHSFAKPKFVKVKNCNYLLSLNSKILRFGVPFKYHFGISFKSNSQRNNICKLGAHNLVGNTFEFTWSINNDL